jgi:hypothetical protein
MLNAARPVGHIQRSPYEVWTNSLNMFGSDYVLYAAFIL